MRKATLFLATVLSGLLVAFSGAARRANPARAREHKQTYKWIDEKGVTHYGDSVPSEYSQREQRVLNSQGLEVQKRQAEMTPAEAAEYAAKQKEESRRKQHDMFLISTYPSVKEIENVRDIAPRADQRPDRRGRSATSRASLRASTDSSNARRCLRPTTPSPARAACPTISPRKWCAP